MASRGLATFMVASPLVAILIIGVNARREPVLYRTQGYPEAQNARVGAFVEPVRQVRQALARRAGSVQTAGAIWCARFSAGELGDLPRLLADDDFSRGVKAQIMAVRNDLFLRVFDEAHEARRGREPERAAAAFVLAAEIATTLKYSDLDTVRESAVRQVSALKRLCELWPNVSQNRRAELRPRLLALMPTVGARRRWARLAERETLARGETSAEYQEVRAAAYEVVAEAKTLPEKATTNSTIRELAVAGFWEDRVTKCLRPFTVSASIF